MTGVPSALYVLDTAVAQALGKQQGVVQWAWSLVSLLSVLLGDLVLLPLHLSLWWVEDSHSCWENEVR